MTTRTHQFSKIMAALALPLAVGLACGVEENDELGASLEADDDGAAAPAGMDDLSIQRQTDAVPGFDVDIAVSGDDVTFDWTASGIVEGAGGVVDDVVILRSEDPNALLELTPADFDPFCGGPGAPSFESIDPDGPSTGIDLGAASGSSATPTYFYRVVRVVNVPGSGACDLEVAEQSTLLAKVTTETAQGYVDFGLCMLGGPSVASQMAAQVGDSVISVHAWDEQNQSWLWYWAADGSGPFGDFALPFGGMVTVNFDDTAPDFVSMVGTVPTDEEGLGPVEGLNYLTTPLLGELAASSASGFVDGLGWYEGVGYWDVQAQTSNWYYGPGDTDFDLEACRSYKFQGAPDPCTSDNECNEGQYCAFDVADACGVEGEGTCTAVPLGCGAEDAPVCGCDGNDYANACEAAAAGVSVGSEGECPPNLECVAEDVAGAVDIGSAVGPAVASGNNTGGDATLAQSCVFSSGADDLILFTAPSDGDYVFDTVGSDYDTSLAAYSSCDDGAEIGCNDDDFSLPGPFLSLLTLSLSEGDQVILSIAGFAGQTGNWVLNITPPAVPCPAIYAPVCGEDGSTYPNECEAGNAGVTAACEGECPCAPPAPAGYDCTSNNPCTAENIAAGMFYWPHTDPSYFVQCDDFGGCFEMPCPPGFVWDQDILTCSAGPA